MEGNLSYWKKGIRMVFLYPWDIWLYPLPWYSRKEAGISVMQAIIKSATNLTSAGQFASFD